MRWDPCSVGDPSGDANRLAGLAVLGSGVIADLKGDGGGGGRGRTLSVNLFGRSRATKSESKPSKSTLSSSTFFGPWERETVRLTNGVLVISPAARSAEIFNPSTLEREVFLSDSSVQRSRLPAETSKSGWADEVVVEGDILAAS